MARKPDFSHLAVVQNAESEPQPEAPQPQGNRAGGLRARSQPVAVYLGFAAHKELTRLAVEMSGPHSKVRVHDLLIKAIQEFCDRQGLQVTVRADDAI